MAQGEKTLEKDPIPPPQERTDYISHRLARNHGRGTVWQEINPKLKDFGKEKKKKSQLTGNSPSDTTVPWFYSQSPFLTMRSQPGKTALRTKVKQPPIWRGWNPQQALPTDVGAEIPKHRKTPSPTTGTT